jgi:hypothetical protein
MARLFRDYRFPVPVDALTGKVNGRIGDGDYQLYDIGSKRNDPVLVPETGRVRVLAGKAGVQSGEYGQRPHVLRRFTAQAGFLDQYYQGRKRELVLPSQSWERIPYALVVTPLLSATMMLTAPVGYYAEADSRGLGLWALNTAPYTWTMVRGLTDRLPQAEENHEDISRRQSADYYFGLYYLFAGGVSLFTDAAAGYGLRRAANYQGRQEFLGDNYTASVLTLAGGGAGHFYKGYRGWGYFYFHLNNALIYSGLYLWSGDLRYNQATDSYQRTRSQGREALYCFGALGVLKTVELVHMLLLPVHIENGTEVAAAVKTGGEIVPVFFLNRTMAVISV